MPRLCPGQETYESQCLGGPPASDFHGKHHHQSGPAPRYCELWIRAFLSSPGRHQNDTVTLRSSTVLGSISTKTGHQCGVHCQLSNLQSATVQGVRSRWSLVSTPLRGPRRDGDDVLLRVGLGTLTGELRSTGTLLAGGQRTAGGFGPRITCNHPLGTSTVLHHLRTMEMARLTEMQKKHTTMTIHAKAMVAAQNSQFVSPARYFSSP